MDSNAKKRKRVSRIGKNDNDNHKDSPLDDDCVKNIMDSMDSLHASEQSFLSYQQKVKSSNGLCSAAAKNNKQIPRNKHSKLTRKEPPPLMQKCKRSLNYMQKNICIPKPRAHVGNIPRPPKNTPRISLIESLQKQSDEAKATRLSRIKTNSNKVSTERDKDYTWEEEPNYYSPEHSDGEYEKFIKIHNAPVSEDNSDDLSDNGPKKKKSKCKKMKKKAKHSNGELENFTIVHNAPVSEDNSDDLSDNATKKKKSKLYKKIKKKVVGGNRKKKVAKMLSDSSDNEMHSNNSDQSKLEVLTNNKSMREYLNLSNMSCDELFSASSSNSVDQFESYDLSDGSNSLYSDLRSSERITSEKNSNEKVTKEVNFNELQSVSIDDSSFKQVREKTKPPSTQKLLPCRVVLTRNKNLETCPEKVKQSSNNSKENGEKLAYTQANEDTREKINLSTGKKLADSLNDQSDDDCVIIDEISSNSYLSVKNISKPTNIPDKDAREALNLIESSQQNKGLQSYNSEITAADSFCPQILEVQTISKDCFPAIMGENVDETAVNNNQSTRTDVDFAMPKTVEDKDLECWDVEILHIDDNIETPVPSTSCSSSSNKTNRTKTTDNFPSVISTVFDKDVDQSKGAKEPYPAILETLERIDFDCINKVINDTTGGKQTNVGVIGVDNYNDSDVMCKGTVQNVEVSSHLNTFEEDGDEIIILSETENPRAHTTVEEESPLDELDRITADFVQELDEPQNSLIDLLEVYKLEYTKYWNIRNTEQNVTAGLKLLEEKQQNKLIHLSAAIQKFMNLDPSFRRILSNKEESVRHLEKMDRYLMNVEKQPQDNVIVKRT